LTDSQVEKCVSFSHLDDGLWTDTSHACSKTAIEFEDDEFVEEGGPFCLADIIVGNDLLGIGWVDTIPVTVAD
jgi:hypothetical protein